MAKGSVEDRLAIRELIEQFCAAVIRIDAEAFAATFAEKDGAWKLPSVDAPARGREEIASLFREKLDYVENISMISFPTDLEISGDTATANTYCRELIFLKAGGHKVIIGCFHDQYVKQDGEWYFASREYEVIGLH